MKSSYSTKRKLGLVPFTYPARMLGVQQRTHWRDFDSEHNRLVQAQRESASAQWQGKYHRFVEDARRFRLSQLDRMR